MRPLTPVEVVTISAELESWVGSQLQDILTTERDLILEFYRSGRKSWMWMDLGARPPVALPFLEWPRVPLQKSTRPLQLFLRSHARSRYLTDVQLLSEWRVRLSFGTDEPTVVTLDLQARTFNVLVEANGKSIWWRKPDAQEEKAFTVEVEGSEPRTLESLRNEWLEVRERRRGRGEKRVEPEALLSKELKKKRKLLEKLHRELTEVTAEKWTEAGEWLKAQGRLVESQSFSEWIDPTISFSENLERIFSRAKRQKRKVVGLQERIQIVEAEIDRLQSDEGLTTLARKQERERTGQWLREKGVQAAHIEIGPDLKFFLGKSGADNLKLLRRARAWDYWLHLKNYPGAHGILQRPKKRVIRREEFEEAGQWVISRSLGKNRAMNIGVRFELIVAECRHVRPIKGDRVGRVTFQNEQTIGLVYKGEDSKES